jgi:hypothetical protein
MTGRTARGTEWNDFGGGRLVDPAEFVAAAHHLLDSAVAAAGDVPGARADLVDGLAAALRLTGPYATLRLDTGLADQPARAELAASAEAAAELVLRLVGTNPGPARERIPDIRSSCVGYSWTPEVVALLLAGPHLHPARNLYNEWLWQLVLLRDALIPFTAHERVRFRADRDGLTRLADARDRFVVEIMTRRVAHAALTRFAAELLAPGAVPGDVREFYGFQADGALVLPPVALDGPLLRPVHLLEQREGTLAGLPLDEIAFFVPADDDQLAIPPTALGEATRTPADVTVVPLAHRLVPGAPGPSRTRTVDLVVGFDGHEWAVDLGQALRGHRYAARPAPDSGPAGAEDRPAAAWSGCAVLRADGAVTLPDGGGVLPTGGQRALVLALLGRLRPGSVVLWAGQPVADPNAVLIDVRG